MQFVNVTNPTFLCRNGEAVHFPAAKNNWPGCITNIDEIPKSLGINSENDTCPYILLNGRY